MWGLTSAQSAALTKTLTTTADIRVQILQLDLSHNLVSTVDHAGIDGQVNIVEADQPGVVRTLQMGFIDFDRALRVDGSAPSAGVGGLDRLIRINVYARSEAAGWLGGPAFTGRPNSIERDGDVVTLEAQSKECLHLNNVDAYTIRKGTVTVEAIRSILARNGETRFRFPAGARARLPGNVTVGGPDDNFRPWLVAWRLARSLGLQLFYDVHGYACLRAYPASYAWRLTEQGTGANLLSRVKTNTDLTTVKNRVVVRGHTVPTKKKKGKPAVKSKVVTGVAVAPASHPLSAQTLAVNGKPWYNTAFYDEPNIHTAAAVKAFANARLSELLTLSTDVQTTMIPVWHLEPLDLLALRTAAGAVDFRLRDASIPLGPSETGMSVGYIQRVRSSSAGRLRRR